MTMLLNDDQEMLRDNAARFMAEAAPVSHLRALRDDQNPDGFSRELWAGFAEMGFTAMLVPEDHGGLGLGLAEAGIILREIGRNLTPSPFMTTALGGVMALRTDKGEAAEQWLPKIAEGKAVLALALDEGVKHGASPTKLRAEQSGNGWKLSGQKDFVLHAQSADAYLVLARTDEGERLFLVDAKADGIERQTTPQVDAGYSSRVTFSDVTTEHPVGGEDTVRQMMAGLRVGAAAEMTGLAEGAAAMTTAYLSDRKQFGVPIGSFQALQHRAAHLYCELEVASAATLRAERLADSESPEAEEAVHVAKATAGWTSRLAVQEAVQMHGGIGMTDEHDIGLFMKRQRVLEELWGDSNYHAEQYARLKGY